MVVGRSGEAASLEDDAGRTPGAVCFVRRIMRNLVGGREIKIELEGIWSRSTKMR